MMGSRCSLTSNTTHSNKKTRIVPSLPCTIPCSDGFSDKETIQQFGKCIYLLLYSSSSTCMQIKTIDH